MNVASPLLELLDGASSHDVDGLTADDQVQIVNELVTALLDESTHIEAMDSYGPKNKCRRFLASATAVPFRKLHEDWLAQVDALLPRLRKMRDAGHAIPRLDELKAAALSRRGLLQITIEKIEAGMAQIRQGNYVTLAEARRELRAKAGR